MLEFQRFIGILFTSYQLLDGRDVECLEGEWVLFNVSIESGLFHQSYHQPIGYLAVEGIVALKMSIVIGVRVSANLSSHCRISGYFPRILHVIHNLSVNRGSHSHLS